MKKLLKHYPNALFVSGLTALSVFTYLNFDYVYFLSAMRLYGG